MKKRAVSIVLMIILILITNVVKAIEFSTLDGFKANVLYGKGGYLYIDKNDENYDNLVKSLKATVSGAKKNKDGVYEIRVYMYDGSSKVIGTLTEAEWKSAKDWIDDELIDPNGSNESEETVTDDTEYRKAQIYNEVNKMIGEIYSKSKTDDKIDYNKYLKNLKNQLDDVKKDNKYTGDLQKYRISLYQAEIDQTEALIGVKKQFEEESKGMTIDDINNKIELLNSNLKKLENKDSNYTENGKDRDTLIAETKELIGLYEEKRSEIGVNDIDKENDAIYQYPNKNGSTSAGSLDDMIGDADKFISSSTGEAITADSLQNFSNIFYNILLTIGIIVAVLVGSILGIKFMIGGAEEKANIKELLMPYIVGCIVVFGAFAIWKIVVTILSSM